MPRNNCTFRKSDLQRAVAAATNAGLAIVRVDFTPAGQITIHTDRNQTALPAQVLGSGGPGKRSRAAETQSVAA